MTMFLQSNPLLIVDSVLSLLLKEKDLVLHSFLAVLKIQRDLIPLAISIDAHWQNNKPSAALNTE